MYHILKKLKVQHLINERFKLDYPQCRNTLILKHNRPVTVAYEIYFRITSFRAWKIVIKVKVDIHASLWNKYDFKVIV